MKREFLERRVQMKPEKYVDSLFEKAKNEPPKLSFEEVVNKFDASVATSTTAMIRAWLMKNLSLNILMSGLFLIFSIVVFSSDSQVFMGRAEQPVEAILMYKQEPVLELQTDISKAQNSPSEESNPKIQLLESPENKFEFVIKRKEKHISTNHSGSSKKSWLTPTKIQPKLQLHLQKLL